MKIDAAALSMEFIFQKWLFRYSGAGVGGGEHNSAWSSVADGVHWATKGVAYSAHGGEVVCSDACQS